MNVQGRGKICRSPAWWRIPTYVSDDLSCPNTGGGQSKQFYISTDLPDRKPETPLCHISRVSFKTNTIQSFNIHGRYRAAKRRPLAEIRESAAPNSIQTISIAQTFRSGVFIGSKSEYNGNCTFNLPNTVKMSFLTFPSLRLLNVLGINQDNTICRNDMSNEEWKTWTNSTTGLGRLSRNKVWTVWTSQLASSNTLSLPDLQWSIKGKASPRIWQHSREEMIPSKNLPTMSTLCPSSKKSLRPTYAVICHNKRRIRTQQHYIPTSTSQHLPSCTRRQNNRIIGSSSEPKVLADVPLQATCISDYRCNHANKLKGSLHCKGYTRKAPI